MAFCAATSTALAAVGVSARMKLLHPGQPQSAQRRISGSNPVLVSSASSTAQIVVAMSSARALPFETLTHGSACALASRGVGIAIVNTLLAQSYLRDHLVMRSFAPPIIHQFGSVTAVNSCKSRLVTAFLDAALAGMPLSPATP